MENYSAHLSTLFHALADPTRRAVIGRLGRGPATITQLAAPFNMALPSFMKHIRLLEHAGWIRTNKDGRVRTCTLHAKTFAVAEGWLSQQRAAWESRTDRLEDFVTAPPKKRKSK
jgi:DNA-binding transcriptional ArsR family regulator